VQEFSASKMDLTTSKKEVRPSIESLLRIKELYCLMGWQPL